MVAASNSVAEGCVIGRAENSFTCLTSASLTHLAYVDANFAGKPQCPTLYVILRLRLHEGASLGFPEWAHGGEVLQPYERHRLFDGVKCPIVTRTPASQVPVLCDSAGGKGSL